MILALLGIFGGHFWLAGDPLGHHTWFTDLIKWENMYPGVDLTAMNTAVISDHDAHTAHNLALGISIGVMLLGIYGAARIYLFRKTDPAKITGALGPFYELVRDKYYIDEINEAVVIKGTKRLSAIQKWIDENIVDGIVVGTGRLGKAIGFLCAWIDRHIVDGLVNWVGNTTQAFGSVMRLFQTGRIQQYISFAVGGAVLVAAFHLLG